MREPDAPTVTLRQAYTEAVEVQIVDDDGTTRTETQKQPAEVEATVSVNDAAVVLVDVGGGALVAEVPLGVLDADGKPVVAISPAFLRTEIEVSAGVLLPRERVRQIVADHLAALAAPDRAVLAGAL